MSKTANEWKGTRPLWRFIENTWRGRTLSCVSCVEHFYLQSTDNAQALLGAATASGLLTETSLLDLLSQRGLKPTECPDLNVSWKSPVVFIPTDSAKGRLDPGPGKAERNRIALGIFSAFHLYHTELAGNDSLIDRAYVRLLHSLLRMDLGLDADTLAYFASRQSVQMSSIARFRTIIRFFTLKETGKWKPETVGVKRTAAPDIRRMAVEFVRRTRTCEPIGHTFPHHHELEQFILDALSRGPSVPVMWTGAGDRKRFYSQFVTALVDMAKQRVRAYLSEGRRKDSETLAEQVDDALTGAFGSHEGRDVKAARNARRTWRRWCTLNEIDRNTSRGLVSSILRHRPRHDWEDIDDCLEIAIQARAPVRLSLGNGE